MRITGHLHTKRAIHVTSQTEGNATGIATEAVPDVRSGHVTRVPFVPATVLRGRLRRAADDIANEEMARHGVRIPVEVFNALRHGSNSGRLVNEPVPPSFFSVQREHPLMGLFGGGPRQGSGGALRVAPLYPVCEELIELGMVPPHPLVQTPMPAYRLSSEAGMFPRLDMMRDDDPTFDVVVEDKDAKIDEIIAADVARRVRKGSNEEGPESTLRSSNLLTFRQMIPGVHLHLDLKVDDRAPDHAKGMLVLALLRVLTVNEIGGMQRIGIGTDVFNLAGAAASLTIGGGTVFDWNGHELSVSPGGEAERVVAAYRAWSDDGRAWTSESLWKASGFQGIDLGVAAVKKAAPARKKGPAAKPAAGGATA